MRSARVTVPAFRLRLWVYAIGSLLAGTTAIASTTPAFKPNIIIILTDDQGYTDVGFNGCKDIPTPNLDRIAHEGVHFPVGYVTHPYCSPSRAGLLSGRMQQRFGHEHNPEGATDDNEEGIPVSEVLLPARLKTVGYTTGIIGKWHLGKAPQFNPLNRGFDEFFGFLGGGFNYFGEARDKDDSIYRGHTKVPAKAITYLTDDFSTEAVQFIQRNKANPFFLYLAYNAPHAPNQATPKYLARFPHLTGARKIYAAMVSAVDDGVGRVLAELKAQGLDENTLVFFLSDNGGRLDVADNHPLRGFKGSTYEGGIRVPFAARWPGHLTAGTVFRQPVSSLDIHATALALAGGTAAFADCTEGVNLIPYLTGTATGIPHEALHWRVAGGWDFAVRSGNYKLAKPGLKPAVELYDLTTDLREQHDLSAQLPAVKARLLDEYYRWDATNVPPLWLDPHIENVKMERAAGIN